MQDINNEMNQIKHRIQSIETDPENINDLKERYREVKEKCTQVSAIMGSLHEDLQELVVVMDRRSRVCKLVEDYFINYMKSSFKKILERRQFEVTHMKSYRKNFRYLHLSLNFSSISGIFLRDISSYC